MAERQDLLSLSEYGGQSFSDLVSGALEKLAVEQPPLAEAEFVASLKARLGPDQAYLDFLAAGIYHYYQPALVCEAMRCAHNHEASAVHEQLETELSGLCGQRHVGLTGDDSVSLIIALLSDREFDRSPRPGRPRRILIPASLSPPLRQSLVGRLGLAGIEAQIIGFDRVTGGIDEHQLNALDPNDFAAMIVPWPNFFGLFEDVPRVLGWAAAADIALVGWVNPQVLAWTHSPARAYARAFTAMVGHCQSLGLPSYRPACTPAFVASDDNALLDRVRANFRQPVAARDLAGLQASLITCHASLRLGGLQGRQNLVDLAQRLCQIDRVSLAFDRFFVNEAVVRVEGIDLERGLSMLAGHNIVAGYRLGDDYPELSDCLLIHCNDRHRPRDLDRFVNRFGAMVKTLSTAPCPVKPKFS